MSNNEAPKEINYKLKGNSDANPQYKYLRVPLSSLTTGLNSGHVDLSTASQLLEFKLPSTEVYNLAKSYLQYHLNLPATGTAGTVSWVYGDTFSIAENMSFENVNGDRVAYVQYVDKYIKVARKLNTTVSELQTNDSSSLLTMCNNLADANYIPAANPADKGTISYIEPVYTFLTGDDSDTIDQSLGFYFPLSGVPNTAFSYDKDLYFGKDMYIRMNTSPVNRIVWTSTDKTSPSTGVGTLAGNITLSNVYLYLAVEKNKVIKDDIVAKYLAGSYKINIPYTQSFQHSTPIGASVANIQISVQKTSGSRLMQILQTVYNANNKLNESYDNDNNVVEADNTQKLYKYRTNLGGNNYLQDYEMICANGDDWYQANKKFCKDSCILNRDVYNANWFHIDRFYSEDQDIENQDVGMEIPNESINWTFESTVDDVKAKLFYTFITSRKTLSISPLGIIS